MFDSFLCTPGSYDYSIDPGAVSGLLAALSALAATAPLRAGWAHTAAGEMRAAYLGEDRVAWWDEDVAFLGGQGPIIVFHLASRSEREDLAWWLGRSATPR